MYGFQGVLHQNNLSFHSSSINFYNALACLSTLDGGLHVAESPVLLCWQHRMLPENLPVLDSLGSTKFGYSCNCFKCSKRKSARNVINTFFKHSLGYRFVSML